jgi:hypothetical protein
VREKNFRHIGTHYYSQKTEKPNVCTALLHVARVLKLLRQVSLFFTGLVTKHQTGTTTLEIWTVTPPRRCASEIRLTSSAFAASRVTGLYRELWSKK